jgi:FdhD protein
MAHPLASAVTARPRVRVALTSSRGPTPMAESGAVVIEQTVTVFVNGSPWLSAAVTPIDLKDWVVGLLAGESAISGPEDITIFQWRASDGQIWVRVPKLVPAPPTTTRYLGSCCGQSRPGFLSPEAGQPVTSSLVIDPAWIDEWFEVLSAWTHTQKSGGLHAAGLVYNRTLTLLRADVGRHNALDKVYGAQLARPDIVPSDSVIVFTGRLSAEIIWKVAHMGCPIVISNTAPTSLGLDLAEQLGVTAIGFARDQTFNVYTHPQRLALPPITAL